MPAFTVTLDVDGEIVVETVIGAIDAQEAIKKAMKRHPTLVLGASPLEIQMELEDVHPDQAEITVDPDTGEVVDPDATGPTEHDFPEITPDGPFEEAAANPFSESLPDPAHAEAVLAEMRGSDPDGLDS